MPFCVIPSCLLINIVMPNSTIPITNRIPASRYCVPGRPDNGVTRYSDAMQPITGSAVGVLKCPPAS